MYGDFTSLHVGKVLSARVLYVYTIDLNIKNMFLVVILQKDTQVLTYLFSQFIKSPIPKAENLQARTNAHILSLTWLWHIGKFIFNLRGKQFSCTQQSFRLLISFSPKNRAGILLAVWALLLVLLCISSHQCILHYPLWRNSCFTDT